MILTRFISTDYGTFGKLIVKDKVFYTVEKPWKNNEPFNSCVPAGDYKLIPHGEYGKDGNVLCLVNEDMHITHHKESDSKRYACLIHTANYERDVVGCIGLGSDYLGDMVANSRKSIKAFYDIVDPQKEHQLTIKWDEVFLYGWFKNRVVI